ncbi:MAG: cysteine--tRNA ligase [Syntrophomonadaceae bacterium]|nr:cysteine--tRNA ligase [Syntrophomonadaceae bacterium]
MIKVYNTLSRKKEELRSINPPKIGMYVCGPTTYNYIHLGNARPLVVFDTIRRYLIYRGFEVTYVQNFTDVDDKIINRAHEENKEAHEIADFYINEYFKDARALHVREADLHPRVSEHIPEIIEAIKALIDKGHAYVRDGDVFFAVSSFPGYGKLSGRSPEDILAGARVEVDERKEEPHDFALWKSAKPGEPYWESPWGKGRPGWHIECSVMSMKYLGSTLDIHGGGADLVFPHHENEIAQSEAYSGQPFVRYWLHNGFITVNKEKMSKSLGNFFIVRDILQKYSGNVVRLYLLSTHYRSPLDFDDSKLEEAERALERIKNSWHLLQEALGEPGSTDLTPKDEELSRELDTLRAEFIMAMDDDFNTALAISHIFGVVRAVNRYLAEAKTRSRPVLEHAMQVFREMIDIIGIALDAEEAQSSSKVRDLVSSLVEFRRQARQEKDYPTADMVRDLLHRQGVILEDSKEGSRIRLETEPELEGLMADIMQMRQSLRKDKNFARADQLRETLAAQGIIIEDNREGSRWRLVD